MAIRGESDHNVCIMKHLSQLASGNQEAGKPMMGGELANKKETSIGPMKKVWNRLISAKWISASNLSHAGNANYWAINANFLLVECGWRQPWPVELFVCLHSQFIDVDHKKCFNGHSASTFSSSSIFSLRPLCATLQAVTNWVEGLSECLSKSQQRVNTRSRVATWLWFNFDIRSHKRNHQETRPEAIIIHMIAWPPTSLCQTHH